MTASERSVTEAAALGEEIESLREQLTLRDQALDATPTFFTISRLTASGAVLVYCNKAVAEQHGYSQHELVGKPVAVLTQFSRSNANHDAAVKKALKAGDTYSFEEEVTRRDGSRFWVGVTIRPLFDSSGRLTHCVGVGADITAKRDEILKKQELQDKLLTEMRERERMGIELQLAQKLESVGRLAAGIAHEINTPIQYVGDSVDFLRSAYGDLKQLIDACRLAIDALPPSAAVGELRSTIDELVVKHDVEFLRAEIPKAFERTFDGVQRVTTIVKAMKEFAHPDDNEQNAADLNHALTTTLLVASNEYKYRARVHTEFGELPEVVCNVGELNQVFLNLIVNAAHAIEDSGKDVESGAIHVSTSLHGDCAVIRVRDNGCGIPAAHLSKLYDPFFTTKEVGRGTGQGLAITHSIVVDKHGGNIDVESTVDAGTEFILTLPLGGRDARRQQP